MELTHVPVFHIDLEDGRKAAAESRGKPTFGDAHVLHRIRVKHAEESKQVVHAVERHTVEEHQVLVGGAPTDVQAACALSSTLNSGQKLKRLEKVHLSPNGGERLDLVDGNLHFRHLHLLFDAVFPLPGHHRLTKRQAGLQFHIELDVRLCQIDREALSRIPQVAHTDGVHA